MIKTFIVLFLTGCGEFSNAASLTNDSGPIHSVDGDSGLADTSSESHSTRDSGISQAQDSQKVPEPNEVSISRSKDSTIDNDSPTRESGTGVYDAKREASVTIVDSGSRETSIKNEGSVVPTCDDKTLVGCTGEYGQPCRTYRLPPYKCVCLKPSEDCVLH